MSKQSFENLLDQALSLQKKTDIDAFLLEHPKETAEIKNLLALTPELIPNDMPLPDKESLRQILQQLPTPMPTVTKAEPIRLLKSKAKQFIHIIQSYSPMNKQILVGAGGIALVAVIVIGTTWKLQGTSTNSQIAALIETDKGFEKQAALAEELSEDSLLDSLDADLALLAQVTQGNEATETASEPISAQEGQEQAPTEPAPTNNEPEAPASEPTEVEDTSNIDTNAGSALPEAPAQPIFVEDLDTSFEDELDSLLDGFDDLDSFDNDSAIDALGEDLQTV